MPTNRWWGTATFATPIGYRFPATTKTWGVLTLNVVAALILLSPLPANPYILILACIMIVAGIWIEKGLGFVVPGFIPTPLGDFVQYIPSTNEFRVCLGIWAFGLLLYTLFVKAAIPIVNQMASR